MLMGAESGERDLDDSPIPFVYQHRGHSHVSTTAGDNPPPIGDANTLAMQVMTALEAVLISPTTSEVPQTDLRERQVTADDPQPSVMELLQIMRSGRLAADDYATWLVHQAQKQLEDISSTDAL
jgi:hypothetical protein